MKQIYSQPILHFLGASVLLFALFSWINFGKVDLLSNEVNLGRESVLQYFQYRNKSYNTEEAEYYILRLSEEAYRNMIERMVREDVLYREALKLGLDNNDYVIKQRLIQKMEYLAGGFGGQAEEISEEDIKHYYDRHAERYFRPAAFTFTHVFVDHAKPDAKTRAGQLLEQLTREGISFSEALKFGDRFLYHSNYVERDLEYIGSHFGKDFAQQLAQATPDENTWLGPISSQYGLHLVLIAEKEKGGVPPLREVRERIYHDIYDERLRRRKDESIQQLIDAYEININELDRDILFSDTDAS